ncbi:testis-specific serine/threonine-protein kinase 1-like isoform X1 [Pleurodeles waltl]|uniref:testis-specific serine/threonine-protein kinase 1-like isoform X1 n=1 Tax=Pleurodeles waltl TaxID=8319 RepID=UPI003709B0D0
MWDLKCENILLDDRGFVKLTDFGFASQYSMSHSLMNTFCGSVAYTAPEILMRKKYNGAMSDVWSLGVILFAMVTGKLPFKERQPYKMLRLIRQGLAFNCPVSKECKDLVHSLLQWKPSARPGLQQVAAHCWMIPTVPSSCQKILLSVGVLTNQSTNQEKQLKEGKKPPSITLLPKNNTLKTLDSPSWLAPISLADNKKTTEIASKLSVPPRPIVQLLSPIQQDDKQSKNPRIFLYRSGTGAPPNPFHNLPNLQTQCSPPHLSSSHSAIKISREKMTKGPMVISEQSEQLISLYPMAAIGKGLALPWSKGGDPPQQNPWASRPKT